MSVIHGANYGTPTLDLNFAENKSLIDTVSGQNFVTFSRSQANYLTTYVGSDGLIKYANANEPRFDHNPVTGECLGLLVEEQRTNLVTRSQEFNSSPWYAYGTITANANTAPDGTVTADQVSSGRIERYDISYTSGVTYTFSVFVKGTAGQTVGIGKLVAGSDGDVILSYTTLNGTWQRLIYTFTSAATTASGSRVVISGSGDKLGTATNFLVWGAQLELGSFPTSYIPTDGTPGGKTRSADVAEITGTNFSRWYNQNQGTFYTKYVVKNISTPYTLQVDDATNNNGIAFVYNSNSITIGTSGTEQYLRTFNVPLLGSVKTIALAYSLNNINSAVDSVLGTPDTSANIPTVTQFRNTGNTVGTISRLTYYPTRLQDYQLQQLTK